MCGECDAEAQEAGLLRQAANPQKDKLLLEIQQLVRALASGEEQVSCTASEQLLVYYTGEFYPRMENVIDTCTAVALGEYEHAGKRQLLFFGKDERFYTLLKTPSSHGPRHALIMPYSIMSSALLGWIHNQLNAVTVRYFV